jgi:hypothetical protein
MMRCNKACLSIRRLPNTPYRPIRWAGSPESRPRNMLKGSKMMKLKKAVHLKMNMKAISLMMVRRKRRSR